MKPSRDPNSTKYPDRTFYQGRWRTAEEIRRKNSNRNSRRLCIFGMQIYLPDQNAKEFARQLREERKESRGDTQD